MITIEDDDAPEVSIVDISTSLTDDWAYRANDSIDVMVDLDSKVDVDGTPLVSLYIGHEGDDRWRGARNHCGSGTGSLVFRYKVQPEDFDVDGIGVGAAASADDGSPAYGFIENIYAAGTDVPINYNHDGLENVRGQNVDGRPHVQSARIISTPSDGWAAYRVNELDEISLNFNTDVVVEGDVFVEILLGWIDNNWDEAVKQAHYSRGSGTDELVFAYTVQAGEPGIWTKTALGLP